jgi:hypothetical protein
MKRVAAPVGGFLLCDNCDAVVTLAVELHNGERMCAECVGVAAALIRDADDEAVPK